MKMLLHMQVVEALVAVNIHGKVPVVLVETGVAAQVVMPTLEMEQRVLRIPAAVVVAALLPIVILPMDMARPAVPAYLLSAINARKGDKING